MVNTHKSGLFCVSAMAARGMVKLEAGPQKSARIDAGQFFGPECGQVT